MLQKVFAQNGEDNGESECISERESDSSSESDNRDSMNPTDSIPPPSSSSDFTISATTGNSLTPSPITTGPSTLQDSPTLKDVEGNSLSSSSSENDNGNHDLDCDDISDKNFIVSSHDPNGIDEDITTELVVKAAMKITMEM